MSAIFSVIDCRLIGGNLLAIRGSDSLWLMMSQNIKAVLIIITKVLLR